MPWLTLHDMTSFSSKSMSTPNSTFNLINTYKIANKNVISWNELKLSGIRGCILPIITIASGSSVSSMWGLQNYDGRHIFIKKISLEFRMEEIMEKHSRVFKCFANPPKLELFSTFCLKTCEINFIKKLHNFYVFRESRYLSRQYV